MIDRPSPMADAAPDQPLQSSPPLQGERVSFTGTLASMTHRQAHELVERHGGTATEHVGRQTSMLVVGEEGWPLESDGRPSRKLEQVTEWNRQGAEVRILNESDWLHLLGLEERQRDVHRLSTPAMLSQMLGVPVGAIRRWERAGLIKAVRRVYRLPYFDFQEVAGARRLSELLASGVPRKEIEAGLERLQSLVPGVDRPLAQLEILAHGPRMLYRDDRGLVEPTGQRCFDFEQPGADAGSGVEDGGLRIEDGDSDRIVASLSESQASILDPQSSAQLHWSAADWFAEGCRFLDGDDPRSAIEALRLSLLDEPGDADVNFHLAEALYRSGNADGALERYYVAVESDHNYLEAWTQIGCLHAERGERESALQAFRVALDVYPDYPDAHWHLADILHQLGRSGEAVPHWETYLRFDSRGPWADQARQRLEEAGTQ